MKTTLILIFITVFIKLSLLAQFTTSCLPNGIVFTQQNQINNFKINHPNCTKIEGDLEIRGTAITNLNGLTNITSVDGGLKIEVTYYLPSLAGLDNLISIGGSFVVLKNPILVNFTGLGNLSNIEGNFSITHNNSLIDLSGLENLVSVGGSLTIGKYDPWTGDEGNPALTNLQGLNNLSSVGGDLMIADNDTMMSLSGLNNLTSVGGNTEIEYNQILKNLTGLDSLSSIGGRLRISNNNQLTSLIGIANLNELNGSIGISSNELLAEIPVFEYLISTGGLGISNNPLLTSLSAFSNINSVNGGISISNNELLTTLTGLNSISYIDDFLIIDSNPLLRSFSGLENLQFVGEYVKIINNNSLKNFNGLNNLSHIGYSFYILQNDSLFNMSGLDSLTFIGREFLVENNKTLLNLSGLGNLTTIGHSFVIAKNESLMSLSGIESLDSIGRDLRIYNNISLSSLTGIEMLSTIDGDLVIDENSSLISLSGLANIDANTISRLTITDNQSLNNCQIQGICDYLTNPSGEVNIYNNAIGCNNPPEIASACGITINCLPFGDYYFSSQKEIDDFITDYQGCNELAGYVRISGDDIVNLDGFIGVTNISGTISIFNNEQLINFSGLDNVEYIWILTIVRDSVLSDITALSNAVISKQLNIHDNSSLSDCSIMSVCSFIDKPDSYSHIYNNAFGCNSIGEVEQACLVSVKEEENSTQFIIHPNPAKNKIFISNKEGATTSQLTIYNQMGQKVMQTKTTDNAIDISGLEKGLFVVEVVIDGVRHREKLIKN